VSSRNLTPGIAAFVVAVLIALIGFAASADSSSDAPEPREAVRLRLLGVNDLHGHLEPPRPGVGGAAWLDAHLDRATLPGRTIRVHAGDMVGASPLVSSWFHDEPAIEAANAMGFDVGTLGNHEFDEGGDELLRLLGGGRRTGPEALKRDAGGRLVNTSSPGFAGASFPYIAANTIDRDGELLLPPYRIVERAGVRVGFIGVTTESTPHFLLPRHADRFDFTDISDAVNLWVPELQARGVEAIVVLAHSGAHVEPGDERSAAGEIVGEAGQMSDAVDVVIAGHSHSLLNLRVPNLSGAGDKLVVEALSYGVAYDRVDVAIDPESGDVVSKFAATPATGHAEVAPDAETGALVERYADAVAPLADRVVGHAPGPLTRANGELGRLAAEAQRELAGADLALVNPGSLRADVDAGPVAYAEAFEVHAYDFPLLRLEIEGRDLIALLAGRDLAAATPGLYVAGLRLGSDGAPVALADGRPLEPGATYTIAANELLATGPSLPALRDAARRIGTAGTEVEALVRGVAAR
jgi:5'-nucleotidase